MATCNRCGAETQRYDTGYPICTACKDAALAEPAENINPTQNDESLRLTHE